MTTANVLKKLLYRFGIIFSSKITRVCLGILKSVVIARMLGPSLRGVYGLMIILPPLIVGFGNLGYPLAVPWFIARKKYDLQKVLGTALFAGTCIGALLAGAGVGILSIDKLFQEDNNLVRDYRVFIILSIPLFLTGQIGMRALIGLSRIRKVAFISLFDTAVHLLLLLVLRSTGLSKFPMVATAWFCVQVLAWAGPLVLLIGEKAYPCRIDRPLLREGFHYGIRGFAAQVFEKGLHRVDFLFVAVFCGAEHLGYYALASRLAEMLMLLPESVFIPWLSMLFGMDEHQSKRITPIVAKILLLVMGFISFLIAVGGPFFIPFLYGKNFQPSYTPLLFLLPGILSISLYPLFRLELFKQNRGATVSLLTSLSFGIHIGLNFLLIPRWGIHGAALSSSIGYFLTCATAVVMYSRLTGSGWVSIFLLSSTDWKMVKGKVRRVLGKGGKGA